MLACRRTFLTSAAWTEIFAFLMMRTLGPM